MFMDMNSFDFAASQERIRRGWELGRTCRVTARAMSLRVQAAETAYLAGLMPREKAARIAWESESNSFNFGPICPGQDALIDLEPVYLAIEPVRAIADKRLERDDD